VRSARAALALAALAPSAAAGFAVLGPVWEGGSGPIHVGALDGSEFRSALASAAGDWEDVSDFDFRLDYAGDGACDRGFPFGSGPLADGVEFETRDCDGFDLGSDTLAVTMLESENGRFDSLGMVFNDDLDWDLYDGAWSNDRPDFRRVALHELGHWLGLDHEDAVPAILSSFAGDLDRLQTDDVQGVRFLYGPSGPPPPPPPPELPPEVVCRRDQLRAAAALCRKRFACEARRAKRPERDPMGLRRAACLDDAELGFARRFAAATLGNAACPWQPAATDALAQVADPADAVAAGLLVGADLAVPADAALRRRLLQRAGRACDAAFAAEARFARSEDPGKRAAQRGDARGDFVERATEAITRAAAEGVAYAGSAPVDAADALDLLVDAFASLAAGS
jgi:hypothetical protein